MKKKTLLVIVTMVVILGLLLSHPNDGSVEYTEGDFVFEVSHHSATVIGYYGKDLRVEIPSHIHYGDKDIPVTVLGSYSLEGGIDELKIPYTIEIIEEDAFGNDINILELDENNDSFTLVDGILYDKDMSTIFCIPISASSQKLVIPDSVITILDMAFPLVVDLRELHLGAGVKTLGHGILYTVSVESYWVHPENMNFTSIDGVLFSSDMKKLIKYPCMSERTHFTVPEGVKELENYSLCDSIHLLSVDLPDTLKKLKYRSFMNCNSLKHITIPDSVTCIEKGAFEECTMLESVYIGSNVKVIEDYCFDYCPFLSDFRISADNKYFFKSGNMVMTDSGKTVVYYPAGCLDEIVVVPEGVEEIKDNAFYESKMIHLTLPNSLMTIGEYAFSNCGELKSITLGKNLKTIPGYAFSGCYSLESIDIPGQVEEISIYAFKNCSSLTTLTLHEGLVMIDGSAFNNTNIETLNIPSTTTDIISPISINNLKEITVAEGNSNFKVENGSLLTANGKELLTYAVGNEDTSCTIPEGVVEIHDYAFSQARNIQTLILPESLDIIGFKAFNKCTSLESLVIPDKVSLISELAFFDCPSLKSVVFGKSVEKIENYAFLMCSSLEDITFKGETLPDLGSEVFQTGTEMAPTTITVHSSFEPGFLDEQGWEYTTFRYEQLLKENI